MIFNQECPPRFPSTVEGRTVMSVIIGIDPHKALHAACAIDRTETRAGRAASPHRPASARAVARVGGTVRVSDVGDRVRWRARLSARPAARRARRACRRCAGDVVVAGACCWARVGRTRTTPTTPVRSPSLRCASPSLAAVRGEDHVSVLRLLAKAQLDISRARSRACSRLHALVRELVAGRDPQGNRCRHKPNQHPRRRSTR